MGYLRSLARIRRVALLFHLLAALAVVGLCGCSSPTGGTAAPELFLRNGGAMLRTITVTPAATSLYAGQAEAMIATGTFTDGSTLDETSTSMWVSSNTAVATVDATGGVVAIAPGSTTISAAVGKVKGKTSVKVLVTLESIAVTPGTTTLAASTTQALKATGSYDSHGTKDLTGVVTWASSNPAVATVSTAGLVTAVAAGTTSITATTSDSASGPITGAATIHVSAATVTAVAVTPASKKLPLGASQRFTATATFSDGTTHALLAPNVTWSSSNAAVATVTTAGVATGTGVGTATLTATHVASGVSGMARLIATAASLVSIAVTPATTTIVAGATEAFAATGTYTDGTTLDLTSVVTWSSSNVTVATISNAGLATGVAAGGVTITATDPVSQKKGSTALSVTAAVLRSITLTPSSPALPAGTTLQLTATGLLSDGTTRDVTTSVAWSSTAPTVGTVSNAIGSVGVVTGLSPGTTTISAIDPATMVTASESLTVGPIVLTGLAVTAPGPSLPLGTTTPLRATAMYSNGSHADVTRAVTWTSSSAAVLVSNASDTAGEATAAVIGSAVVTATDPSTGVQGSVTITATAAVLTGLTVAPSSALLQVGTTLGLTATGTFSDSSSVDLTAQVTWSSSGGVTVSNADGSHGLVTATALGSAMVTALDAATGLSASASLTVGGPALIGVTITPGSGSIPVGMVQAFVATGTFSDGSTANISGDVSWVSSVPATAAVVVGACNVVVTADAVGSATLTATDPATLLSASVPVTVTPNFLETSVLELRLRDPNGVVLTPATAAGVSVTASATIPGGTFSSLASPDCGGTYALLVPTGAIGLQVISQDPPVGGGVVLPNEFEIIAGIDVSANLAIDLTIPTTSLTVHVTDPSNAAVQGATVSLSDFTPGALDCGPGFSSCVGGFIASSDVGGVTPALTDPSGDSVLYGLAIPDVTVSVGAPSGAGLLNGSATLDASASPTLDVSLQAGTPLVPLMFHVRDANNTILTPANAPTLLVSVGNLGSYVTSDATGTYTAMVTPGSVLVGAQSESPIPGLVLPETFGFGGFLNVTGALSFDVVVPTVPLTVHVTDSSNAPVAGAGVSLTQNNLAPIACGAPWTSCDAEFTANEDTSGASPAATDASGDVSLYGLAMSGVGVSVTAPSGSMLQGTTVTGDASQSTTLDVSLAGATGGGPTAVVSFRLFDAEGEPLTPATLPSLSVAIGSFGNTVTPDGTGLYSATVDTGEVLIAIQGTSAAGFALPDSFGFGGYLNVTADVSFDLSLPTEAITVAVTDPSNNPVPGAVTTLSQSFSSLASCGPFLTGCEVEFTTTSDVNAASPATTDATGAVSLFGFASSAVQVSVAPPEASGLTNATATVDASTATTFTVQLP